MLWPAKNSAFLLATFAAMAGLMAAQAPSTAASYPCWMSFKLSLTSKSTMKSWSESGSVPVNATTIAVGPTAIIPRALVIGSLLLNA
jgi:hypothetical protein